MSEQVNKSASMPEKELSEDILRNVSGGYDENLEFSQEQIEKGICGKGITAETFPRIIENGRTGGCVCIWWERGSTQRDDCCYLYMNRSTGQLYCELCGYVEK